MNKQQMLQLFEMAVETKYGISLLVSDQVRCRQALYKAKTGEPRFQHLQLRIPPGDQEHLWVVNGEPSGPQAAQSPSGLPKTLLEDLDLGLLGEDC